MGFLLLVVGLNVLFGVLFKLFPRWNVHSLGAIVVNYWTCVIIGSGVVGTVPVSAGSLAQPWALPSFLLGFGFMLGFNLIAWCTVHYGIATTTLAGKLSLVIPAAFALFYFPEEHFHWTKIAGMALAFPALYLSLGNGAKAGEKYLKIKPPASKKAAGWGIAALFVLSGALDTGIANLNRTYFITESAMPAQLQSLVHLFLSAAVGATAVLLYQQYKCRAPGISPKTLLAGLLLGLPNYFSVYALLRLLSSGTFQPSVALPVVNIGIVTLAVLLSIFAFREGGGTRRWGGLALAVGAILLLSYTSLF